MANPTTNFGWVMPTSTDLVTDLPADFAVFGQAVDTSMADLKGGTTGQILAKATNTDMDFTWITNDQGDITAVTAGTGISGGGTSGAVTITNSMATEITAKGDLIVGTGSATFDNLAAGADGSTLVTDSAATTGLRYSATPSASNPIINSAFQVWQRGTSFAGGGAGGIYTADRFQLNAATAQTMSRQVTGDTTNLPFVQYCARIQRTAASTNTTAVYVASSFESVNCIPYAGKGVTLSFYARVGANWAGTSFGVQLISGTGTDQNLNSGFTGSTNVISVAPTFTTTWQRFTYTGTVASTATQLGLLVSWLPSGTAGAADYVEMTGFQIDIGSVALPFRTYAATIQGELAAAQRYYQQFGGGMSGAWDNTTTAVLFSQYPVTMRVAPTIALLTTTPQIGVQGGSDLTGSGSAIAFSSIGLRGFRVGINGFTGATQYRGNWVSTQSTDILSASSEL